MMAVLGGTVAKLLASRIITTSPCAVGVAPILQIIENNFLKFSPQRKHYTNNRSASIISVKDELGGICTCDKRTNLQSSQIDKVNLSANGLRDCPKSVSKCKYSTLSRTQGHVLSRNGLVLSNELSKRRLSLTPKAVLDASPLGVQPYLRLIRFDKPIGSYLLYWPCTWSIALAASPGHLPDFKLLALFGAGAFFMRGAGCIINDLYDREFDKMVQRTKTRPLASGELNALQAFSLLAFQLSVSLGILLQLNWYSVALGASSMGLVLVYPLCKRFTYWPQVVLGLTFNWGALLGWSAVQGSCSWGVVLPLYVAGVAWTLVYDTIYAHQDKEDDILVGVKSTALKFGEQTKPWLSGFSALMISNLCLTGYMCDQTWPYYLGVGLVSGHLAKQIYTVDLDNPDDCFSKFKANSRLGILLFLGIMAGTLAKTPTSDTDKERDSLAS